MANMGIFGRWDLLFGSGFQTLGALTAAIAAGWFLSRSALVTSLGGGRRGRILALWIQWVIPSTMIAVGLWWLSTVIPVG